MTDLHWEHNRTVLLLLLYLAAIRVKRQRGGTVGQYSGVNDGA
jgi:hypothetical protein